MHELHLSTQAFVDIDIEWVQNMVPNKEALLCSAKCTAMFSESTKSITLNLPCGGKKPNEIVCPNVKSTTQRYRVEEFSRADQRCFPESRVRSVLTHKV